MCSSKVYDSKVQSNPRRCSSIPRFPSRAQLCLLPFQPLLELLVERALPRRETGSGFSSSEVENSLLDALSSRRARRPEDRRRCPILATPVDSRQYCGHEKAQYKGSVDELTSSVGGFHFASTRCIPRSSFVRSRSTSRLVRRSFPDTNAD